MEFYLFVQQSETYIRRSYIEIYVDIGYLYIDVNDMLLCSAMAGNDRVRRARHSYLGRALGSFACAKYRTKHRGPPF